jgi:hypothetical protein
MKGRKEGRKEERKKLNGGHAPSLTGFSVAERA